MAWTRPQPGVAWPNNVHAKSNSRSLSQKRLARRKTSVSSGSCSTGTWFAPGADGSGSPVSFTTASVEMRTRPAGADDPAAPVTKPVAVAGDRHRWVDDDVVRSCEVGNTCEVDVEHQNYRARLGKVVLQLATDPKFHRAVSGLDVRGPSVRSWNVAHHNRRKEKPWREPGLF